MVKLYMWVVFFYAQLATICICFVVV